MAPLSLRGFFFGYPWQSRHAYNAAVTQPSAETAYLFRHALLRDAAYELQPPGVRARLHGLALEGLESLFGGVPPGHATDVSGDAKSVPCPIDAVAAELAEHAHRARTLAESDSEILLAREALYMRRAAEHAERAWHTSEAFRLWQRYAELAVGVDKTEAVRKAGMQALHSGHPKTAEAMFMEARRIASSVGDCPNEGMALANLALLYQQTGQFEASLQCYAPALELFRQAGNRRFEGVALGDMAGVYQQTGRLELAEQLHDQALAIHREVGNRRSEGVTIGNLAGVYQDTGRYELTERAFESAIAIHREVGNRRSEGTALGNLALLYLHTGRVDLAEQTFAQALAIQREVGNRRSVGVLLGNAARVFHATGRSALALESFEQALAIHREVHNRRFEGMHLCDYAECLLTLGRTADAQRHWKSGAELLLQLGDLPNLAQRRKAMLEACAEAGVPPLVSG